VREKPSDEPEPGAEARSQSFLVAASLSVPLKMPVEFERIFATVVQWPFDP
jgi:hypothetical protein